METMTYVTGGAGEAGRALDLVRASHLRWAQSLSGTGPAPYHGRHDRDCVPGFLGDTNPPFCPAGYPIPSEPSIRQDQRATFKVSSRRYFFWVHLFLFAL